MKNAFLLLSVFAVNSAFALILPTETEKMTITKSFELSGFENDYDYNGIAKLSNCSGSLIKLSGQSVDSPAIMMTNGHCIKNKGRGFLKAGEVVVNRRVVYKAELYNDKMDLIPVRSKKLLYATMTNTDVAYYELGKTYSELSALGVESFELDTFMPLIGTKIDIVSGYWDRGYRCHVDGFAFALREGDWTFTNSIRYADKGCETIGGTSGSPIIETATRKVIGINNTGNREGGTCTLNNPCEEDADGGIQVMLRSYGQQTYNIYSCLTVDFKIDLTMEGCTLPR